MRYKEDWEKAKMRHEAFWRGDILDRCCISVKACDTYGFAEKIRIPDSDQDRVKWWTDPELIISRSRLIMENTYYGGESFPAIFVNLGAGGHAGFFRGEKHYFSDTVWFLPEMTDVSDLEFDENSFLYKKTIEIAKACVEDSQGDYMVGMPDTTGNADALTHLMGTEELLPAMLEDPEMISCALTKIEDAYERIMSEVYTITRDNNEGGGVVDWLSTWAPGFHAQMQCDMSVMISNDLYKEFILPEIKAQSGFLDYPLYHFDGIEQRRHLDMLLSVPELKAIQWTQVVGQPPCTEFFDDLRRIQEAGKNLILIVTPDQIKPIMENLSSKRLFMTTTVKHRDEADAIIKKVTEWTHE